MKIRYMPIAKIIVEEFDKTLKNLEISRSGKSVLSYIW